MQKLAWFIGKASRASTVVGGFAIALMMIHITIDVAARYLLNSPLPGTITIVSNYYMVVAVFLPLALVEVEDGHISVDVFTAGLGPLGQRIVTILSLAITSAMSILFMLKTWEEAIRAMKSGDSVLQGMYTITIWPSYFLLPLGFGLMVVVVSLKLATLLSGKTVSPFTEFTNSSEVVDTYND